ALLVEIRSDELRIRRGPSLRLVLDGDTVLLVRDSLASAWPRVDPAIQEQARYAASDSLMRRFAQVSDVRVAVRGAGWWESRRLSAHNLETLRGFVTLYVPADTSQAADSVQV